MLHNRTLMLAAVLAAAAACRQAPAPPNQSSAPPAAAAAQPARAPLAPDLQQIVDAFRKIIVLLEDQPSLDAAGQQRAELAGRMLFQENHERLTQLGDRLDQAMNGAPPAPAVVAFLDALEQSEELHDADKLAFRDVLGDLADATRAAQTDNARALRARIESDQTALKQIEALYDKELDRIFGRFETRGMTVRRESWEAYVAFLKTRFKSADILKEYEAAAQTLTSTTRGAGPAESAVEMSGTRLPAKSLVLTFDDGPHPTRTDAILKILKEYKVPAVFFEVGQNVGTWDQKNKIHETRAAAAAKRLIAEGYPIANHTYTHSLLPKLTDAQIADQIEQTNRALHEAFDLSPVLFRPPYGAKNDKVMAAVQARHMKTILWNIDSKDWADPIPKSIANRVVQTVEGEKRGIMLFHDIQARTIEALPLVLETLQARGYRFLGWNGTDFVDPNPQGAPVAAAQPAAAPAKLYRQSWAVVIGIDQYEKWPKLAYAVNDARAIQELLVRKYQFDPTHVALLLNGDATRQKILSAIGDALSDPSKVTRDDRVFIFFAGHGATRRLPNGRALGYIIPSDADLANYQSQAISMTNFQDISELIPAKHVLFVTDACYSGLAATRGGGQNYLQEVTRRMARQVLTAGGADEEVADNGPNGHSIFTWTVLQALEGRADLNNDGFITASEMASYVGPLVSSLSHQTPAFASLPGSEGGEFVFELAHDDEFLSDVSSQLDEEAIKLNGELERLRKSVLEKKARNEKLRQEVAAARAELGGGAPAPPPPGAMSSADHNDAGTTLFKEKRYDEAAKEFAEAVRTAPSNALAMNNLGFTYFKLDKFDQAADVLKKTIALDPKRAIAYANLGDALVGLKRTAEARTAYEKYLELQPNAKYAATVRDKLKELK